MRPFPFTTDDEIFAPRAFLAWLTFALAAGCVNAGAFMACHNFVTHVTGLNTNLGMDAADPGLAFEFLIVFAAFIVGAGIAVYLVEKLREKSLAVQAIPYALVTGLLVGVGIAGHADLFGPWGIPDAVEARTFTLLSLLALAMGIQNAAVGVSTGNAVRTTHATGPATDFAANLVRAGLQKGMGSKRELRWATLRFSKILSFAAGAAITAKYADLINYHVFTVAAFFVTLAAGLAFGPRSVAVSSSERTESSGPHVRRDALRAQATKEPEQAA